MTLERWLVGRGLFAGRDLVDELAFVRWFHHHPGNVALHAVGLAGLVTGVAVVLAPWSVAGVPVACLVASAYVAAYAALDRAVAALAAVVLAGLLLVAHRVAPPAPATALATGAALALAGLVLQGIGHVFLDRSLPAFRAFEALFTTPFFVLLTGLFRLGYAPRLAADVAAATPRWAGSERRTFGARPVRRA